VKRVGKNIIWVVWLIVGLAVLIVVGLSTQSNSSEDTVDTTGWNTFQHEAYPFEFKYPVDGVIQNYVDELRIQIQPNRDNSSRAINIYSALDVDEAVSDEAFDLVEYVNREVTRVRAASPSLSSRNILVEDLIGDGWQGYQYSILLYDHTLTTLYMMHNGKLYMVLYDAEAPTETAIVSTLRFID